MNSIYDIYKKICRFFFWGWKLRGSYDFDYNYVYHIIFLKLERMECYFLKHGICEWCEENSKLMKKLKIAKNLAKRLQESKYVINGMGPLKQTSVNCNIYNKSDDCKKYRKKLLRAYKKSDMIERNEHELLFKLLSTYLHHWWD